ncbi:Ribokinase [Aquimixticola soesokkakensis]|uniref:Ribokinase n=1 Tax=Aquimixticola soesokkakensis TaxID=1519096 RepID=A0A1Y5RYF2_9RHOB|nr:PfkB family carbohydrate kinase [Aquimixticola soesokkakensis]SLN27850.1 Ribokinase [Aquimixticola soesokkakensis]
MTAPTPLALIIGSLHYDIMVETDHLPRLDETAVGTRWFPKFGGKGGNQAVAARPSRMVGAVGADEFGTFLRAHLQEAGVDHSHVATLPDAASGMSVAIMNRDGDYAATIVSGANLAIDPDSFSAAGVWQDVAILVLQNEVSEAVNLAAARAAKARNIPVLLNAAPARALSRAFSDLVDILVVNAVEAEMFGTPPVQDLASAKAAAAQLAAQFPAVVVTAGAQGLGVARDPQKATALPAIKVNAVSSHGAGDCFTGALANALIGGAALEQACQTAAQAAANHVAGHTSPKA